MHMKKASYLRFPNALIPVSTAQISCDRAVKFSFKLLFVNSDGNACIAFRKPESSAGR